MVADYLESLNLDALKAESEQTSIEKVVAVLQKQRWSVSDMPILLSPAASHYLGTMKSISEKITRQRFGHTMKLFVPMYVSNVCYNRCTYCGFSMDLDYPRKVLNKDEIQAEISALKSKGFQHVLLLTGEAPDVAGIDYLASVISLLSAQFASVGIEVQPLKLAEYQRAINAGAASISLYQETYSKPHYLSYHLSGKKRQFKARLAASDNAGEAGFFQINLGALLGLYEWRYDMIALAYHVDYMQKKYWRTRLGISVPRIQEMKGVFNVDYQVSDADMIQIITAMRMVFPDIAITISTRERDTFRDEVCTIGVTEMSAESKTSPGGYCGLEEEGQFSLSDHRSVISVCEMLKSKNLDPMMKDWANSLTKSS